jgi:hopanoid C-3 methylase
MKVLLVRPPITLEVARRLQAFLHLEPLALEIVAGGIPSPHVTRILDLASEKSVDGAFLQTLAEFKPDLIGFTAYSNEAATVKRLAAMAKSRRPGVTIMVGGTHATIAPDDLRLPGTIDLVIRGEGGTAMRELIPLLEKKTPLPESDAFLPTNSPRFAELASAAPPALPPFDQVPPARRDLVDRSRYYCIWHGKPGERLPTLFPRTAAARTSVGCPHRCSFCVVHYLASGKYVRRTPEDAVNEILGIPEEHVYFLDDEMFIDAKRAEAIGRLLLECGVRKSYVSWARSDTIVRHPELFKLWKQVGLTMIYVGLESMDPDNLRDYNKAVTPDVNRQAIAILRELDISLHASLMVNPDFTEADFQKVRRAIGTVGPAEMSFTVFSPPPGTELWKKHRAEFCCPDPYGFYDGMHTLLPTKMPLKKFYRQLSMLWLFAARNSPLIRNKLKVPFKDRLRFWYSGFWYGYSVQHIYKDYNGKPVARGPRS